jgi:Protein of unknown function (DUF3352)
MKARLALLVAVVAAVFAATGCGGSSSSSSNPATLAPPKAPLFIEATLRPEGELKTNIESLAKSLGGVDDLGGLIVSKLEAAASSSGQELDFEKEVEPWLGEKGGLFFQEYDGNNFHGYGVAIQTTDAGASEEFIDKRSEASGEPAKAGSYEGDDFKVETEDGTTVGVVEGFLVVAEDEATFKTMVDASKGESLADENNFASTVEAAPSGSFANVFVNIGGLIEQSGGPVDTETLQFLESAGIDPNDATAVASLVPGSDQVEVDISSDLSGEGLHSGDASSLLGSLPSSSVAAFASAEFGKRFEKVIDHIDASGIKGQVPPHKLKSTLKEAGLDLDKISASIGDLGVFAEGSSEGDLAGAAVLTTKGSQEATNTVSNVGLLLRAAGTPGVTAISGKASGFSVRSAELGRQPLVVAAEGERIAIAYGLPAATQALSTSTGETLADNPAYKEAVDSLGSTPISGFVDGPAALQLAAALVPPGEAGFREAQPYLTKVDYAAIGTGSTGDQATAKLILGIGK